jgi:hypothetical protein
MTTDNSATKRPWQFIKDERTTEKDTSYDIYKKRDWKICPRNHNRPLTFYWQLSAAPYPIRESICFVQHFYMLLQLFVWSKGPDYKQLKVKSEVSTTQELLLIYDHSTQAVKQDNIDSFQ